MSQLTVVAYLGGFDLPVFQNVLHHTQGIDPEASESQSPDIKTVFLNDLWKSDNAILPISASRFVRVVTRGTLRPQQWLEVT